jgi:aryl-alcohol dehydrogenase-like predicted oxidoreductase
MMFGSEGKRDHDECVAIIHAALDGGINFIDTADIYSSGESETIVGKALAGQRDRVVLATKFHFPMNDDPTSGGNSRRWIIRACEDSLRRLATDYIDLYQVHRPDPHTDIEETLRALDDLVRQGKVRYTGHSTFLPSQIVESQWAAQRTGTTRFVSEQPPYSILVRGIERDVLPTCERHRMAVLTWSPLDRGWLSGKWRLEAPQETLTSNRAQAAPAHHDVAIPGNYDKLRAVDALAGLAAETGVSLPELAVAFVIQHPAVTSAIIGPRTMGHLTSLLGAPGVPLTDETLDAIDAIVPPGTNCKSDQSGYEYGSLPALKDPKLRRRQRA